MQLKKFQAFVHNLNDKDKPTHVDVELTFKDTIPTIKLCHCTAYMGGMDSFGDVAAIAAQVREDLGVIANSGTQVRVVKDLVDGSIDLLRLEDGALLFSMEAEKIEGDEWVEFYCSGPMPTGTKEG